MSHEPGEGFEGPWWRYPLLRNGLVAGMVAALGYVLESSDFMTPWAPRALYLIAIPVVA